MHEITEAKAGPVRDLRERFRLTSREVELSTHLLSGKRLAHAAQMMGMSVSTARQHVKSVFAKTGTHGQAELIALLGRLGTWLLGVIPIQSEPALMLLGKL